MCFTNAMPLTRAGLLLFAAMSLALAASAADKADSDRLDTGDPIPLELGLTRGGDKLSTESFSGVPMVITFWASWCPPCMRELPVLESLQELAGPERLRVVAVNWKEERRVFRSFVKQLDDVDITITHDRKGRVAAQYGVRAIPHMLLVDAEGNIVKVYVGYNEEKLPEIVDQINALIAAN